MTKREQEVAMINAFVKDGKVIKCPPVLEEWATAPKIMVWKKNEVLR